MTASARVDLLAGLELLFGLPLDASRRRRVEAYLDLLVRWNARIDLTAPMSPDRLLADHLFEAFWAAGLLRGGESLADLGSGAGLPGLALQIYRPQLKTTLIEARHKRAVFLKEVCRELCLDAVVFAGRGEDFPAWTEVDFVSIRALKPSLPLLERLAKAQCTLLWFHGGESPGPTGPFRILLQRRTPGTHDRRVSLLAAADPMRTPRTPTPSP